MRFTISPTSSTSQVIEKTGQYNVGTLVISYTVYCSTGYCGNYCQQSKCDNNSTLLVDSSTTTAGLSAVSVLFAICFVALVVFIILFFFLVAILLNKRTQASKMSGMTKIQCVN